MIFGYRVEFYVIKFILALKFSNLFFNNKGIFKSDSFLISYNCCTVSEY